MREAAHDEIKSKIEQIGEGASVRQFYSYEEAEGTGNDKILASIEADDHTILENLENTFQELGYDTESVSGENEVLILRTTEASLRHHSP